VRIYLKRVYHLAEFACTSESYDRRAVTPAINLNEVGILTPTASNQDRLHAIAVASFSSFMAHFRVAFEE